jgi:hypothetical protein
VQPPRPGTRGGTQGRRRLSGGDLSRLPSRAMRPRARRSLPDRELPRAGR